ncbi:MAG: hypothetical protein M3N16_07145, partial [Actinomycetota bacterium]|nr:hypothetical protein [Actinomycetota bacterium]
MRRIGGCVLASVIALVAAPSEASAGSVIVTPPGPTGRQLVYRTDPGEVAILRLTYESGSYVFEDPSSTIRDGGGAACTPLDGEERHRVACPDRDFSRVELTTGEGNDRIVLEGLAPFDARRSLKLVRVIAGAGDDLVTGGPQSEIVDGGPGADAIDGGGGDDSLYGAGGPGGEIAGDRDDVLQGGEGEDYLLGMVGDDRLDGGAGDDGLEGHVGADELRGGAGDDNLDFQTGFFVDLVGEADEGDDLLDAGPGNDNIWAGRGHDVVAGDDGDDRISSMSQEMRPRQGGTHGLPDEAADRVGCGAGGDAIQPGPNDAVGIDCERVEHVVNCPLGAEDGCTGSIEVDA